ncbi:MAG: ATP-dependent Clp protease ATP-binding subunit [Clostridiales bacterium]|nr:ATP-dependent Clp protease ATP-binding subunit [Clostridiales bacterium]
MTEKGGQVLRNAEKTSCMLDHGYIGTEHLLLGLLQTDCMAAEVLRNLKVTEERVLELVARLIAPEVSSAEDWKGEFTPKAREVLQASYEIAQKMQKKAVGSDHLLLALIRNRDCVAIRLLNTMEVSYSKLNNDLADAMGPEGAMWKEEEEERGGGSSTLNKFSRDLTALAAAGKLDPVIGREKELDRLIQILSRRNKNNPCLIGEPGVGKTAIVESLALRIADGQVPGHLQNLRLLALDLSAMVAGTKYRGEFEERIKKVIQEASGNKGVLLFLDEIHTLIGAGGAEGGLDAANILKPALSRGEIQLIGATTMEEYRKHIEKDSALERRFQPIVVEEPSEEETLDILRGLRHYYERHHSVVIRDDALEAAVRLSARYIHDRFLPDKALDLLDEAAAHVRLFDSRESRKLEDMKKQWEELEVRKEESIREQHFDQIRAIQEEQQKLTDKWESKKARSKKRQGMTVTEEDIAEVVAEWTKIPVKRLAEQENDRLRNLEKVLHRRVIGQNEAVVAVSRAIRRSRLGLKNPSRPIGSFLFLGPTGVGKTELSKALAEAMFGQESALIRVDMSEYMEKHSVSKIIGSPPGYVGYEEGGQLSERVRRNPYCVILFDEIEKAHPDVFNILLQILDDGHVTDAQGRKVDFKNAILIMTSNAGAERIVEPKFLGFSAETNAAADHDRMKKNVMEEVKRLFKPEFLNRIDDILVFHALDRDNMKDIFRIMLKQINEVLKESQQMHVTLNPAARDWILERGLDQKYGARPLRRALQTYLEDGMADELLAGNLHRGDEVRVTLVKNQLKFTARKENSSTSEEAEEKQDIFSEE